MGRTTNRPPASFNPRVLDEKYLNFDTFSGLDDDKNYLTSDQRSFEEALNVFVDQDNQLSSRPPLKRIDVLPEQERIIKIYKVNMLTIYHTLAGDVYRIRFKFGDDWYYREVTETINCAWWDTRFVVFTETEIFGFEYDYTNSSVTWYDTTAMVYVPVTETVQAGVRTPTENDNAVSELKIIRYIHQYGIPQATSELVGRSVLATVGSETFEITFTKHNEAVYAGALSKSAMPSLDDILPTSMQCSDKYSFLAFNDNRPDIAYYSSDGILFTSFSLPWNVDMPPNVYDEPILSDDGACIYGMWVSSDKTGSDVGQYGKKCRMYKMLITAGYASPTDVWVTKEVNAPTNYDMNHWAGGEVDDSDNKVMSSNRKTNFRFGRRCLRSYVGHSPENGKVIFNLTGGLMDLTIYRNTSNTFSTSGASHVDTDEPISYLITWIDDDALVHSSGTQAGGVRYPADVPYYYPVQRIKLAPSSADFNIAFISAGPSVYSVVMNTNYVPYYRIAFWSEQPYAHLDNYTNYYHLFLDIYQHCFSASTLTASTAGEDLFVKYSPSSQEYSVVQAGVSASTDKMFSCNMSVAMLSGYIQGDYELVYTYLSYPGPANRTIFPVTRQLTTSEVSTSAQPSSYFKLGDDSMLLTDSYLWLDNTRVPLLSRADMATLPYNGNMPVHCDGSRIYYYNGNSKTLYGTVLTDTYTDLQLGELTTDKFFVPYKLATFTANVAAKDNKLYVAENRNGQVYFPVGDVESFAGDVTNLAVFTKTSLGVFLEGEIWELMKTESALVPYEKYRTKLQLACKKGSDVLLDYSGTTIFLTTLKGLSALTYQDFVQSSEQIYSYLTDKVISEYDGYKNGPIKLFQYKDWLFMYNQTSKNCYIFDARTSSWWKWSNFAPLTQLVSVDDKLIALINGNLYEYVFDGFDTYSDDVGQTINWKVTSQRLHFQAINNYKHIRSLSLIVADSKKDAVRCKLTFRNYRNLSTSTESDVIEQDVDLLTTVLKKVNFLKTNAFQFTIENDRKEKQPQQFVTSNIALKYRITERIR